jgi:hypothetical protein
MIAIRTERGVCSRMHSLAEGELETSAFPWCRLDSQSDTGNPGACLDDGWTDALSIEPP